MPTDSTFLLHAVSKDLMIFLPSSDSQGLRLPWWPFYFTKHRVNVTGVLTKSVNLKKSIRQIPHLSAPGHVKARLPFPPVLCPCFACHTPDSLGLFQLLQQHDWAYTGGVGAWAAFSAQNTAPGAPLVAFSCFSDLSSNVTFPERPSQAQVASLRYHRMLAPAQDGSLESVTHSSFRFCVQ